MGDVTYPVHLMIARGKQDKKNQKVDRLYQKLVAVENTSSCFEISAPGGVFLNANRSEMLNL